MRISCKAHIPHVPHLPLQLPSLKEKIFTSTRARKFIQGYHPTGDRSHSFEDFSIRPRQPGKQFYRLAHREELMRIFTVHHNYYAHTTSTENGVRGDNK